MELIFDKLGLRQIRVNPALSYELLTLEFLATVERGDVGFEPYISFRLGNEPFVMSVESLRRAFMIDDVDERYPFEDSATLENTRDFWGAITGDMGGVEVAGTRI